jgi:hypothetical protein
VRAPSCPKNSEASRGRVSWLSAHHNFKNLNEKNDARALIPLTNYADTSLNYQRSYHDYHSYYYGYYYYYYNYHYHHHHHYHHYQYDRYDYDCDYAIAIIGTIVIIAIF